MLSALSQHFLEWETFFRGLGFVGVVGFAVMIVVVQFFCLPLSPLGIMAGLFFGVANGFIAVELGTGLGAALNFLLSRYFLRERFARWLSGHEKFQLIDTAIGREGWKIVALLRFCPIPYGFANYCYGLTAVRFGPYLLTTALAVIPANFFFVWFGATSHDALAVLTGGVKATPGQAAFTVIGLVAFFLVLTYIAKIAHTAVSRGEQTRPAGAALAPSEKR